MMVVAKGDSTPGLFRGSGAPAGAGSVECLGMTFDSDEARRGYFLEKLREKLSAMTGSEVLIEVERDEKLIGGLVCRLGGVVMDGSISNQLRGLRRTLLAD